MKKFAIILAIPALLAFAACTADIGANQYDSSSVGSVTRALKGKIVSVRSITVRDDDRSTGTTIGGVAGGVAGSQIGKGATAGVLGAVGGALIGGVAGNLAQSGLSSQSGYEYIIQLDNGGVVSVTQGDDVVLGVGQPCMVIYGNGRSRARVIPYYGN